MLWKWDAGRRELVFVTKWKVEVGEELLIDYRLEEKHMRLMLGGESCPICKFC